MTTRIQINRTTLTQLDLQKQFDHQPVITSWIHVLKNSVRQSTAGCSPWKFLKRAFPILEWLPAYRIPFLSNDCIAGSTIAILNIPQAMAYAALAGVPATIGLYTSFFPALLYGILGTSKHISLGMFAIIALMTANVEHRLVPASANGTVVPPGTSLGDVESVQVVAVLTFAIGLVLGIMALCQIQFVSDYLSDQVIAGFTTGAACHVLWSQIPKIFSLKLPVRQGLLKLVKIMIDFITDVQKTNVVTLVTSIACIVFLYIGKTYINPVVARRCPVPIPFELIVVIVSTVVSVCFEFHAKHSVPVVGHIPVGLPVPRLPHLSRLPDVFPDAIIIAVVIYAVSFSVAKLFAKKHGYRLNAAQEVRALCAVEILTSFVLCHPSCASLSRSAVNSNFGVHSQVSSVVSSCIMLSLILWLGPLVEQLPMCVLACIIVVALKPMFMQLTQLRPLWKTSKIDFFIWLVAFLATVLWDVSEGLIIAVGFALFTIVLRLQYPPTQLLAPLPGTELFREKRFYGGHEALPIGVTVVRFNAPLLFVNVDEFKATLGACGSEDASISRVILDGSGITTIDRMGAEALCDVAQTFKNLEITFAVAALSDEVIASLKTLGGFERIGHDSFFPSILDAAICQDIRTKF